MVRSPRAAWAALTALAFGAPGVGRAEPRLHATGAVSVGVSDNPLAAPSDPPPGTAGPVTVAFTDLRPGLLVFLESARVSNRLRLAHSTNIFFGHSEANSYSNAADWSTFVALAPRASLVLGAGVTQGRLNTLSTLTPSAQTQLGAVQTGGVNFIAPTANEAMTFELAPLWRLAQSLSGGYYTPAFGSQGVKTGQADLRASVERVFERDSVGVEGRLGYTTSTATLPSGESAKPQIIEGGAVRWRHDWTRFWSSQADLGWVRAVRATDGGGAVSGVTALAALRYTKETGTGELSYTRTVAPNLPLGQLFYGDTVTLRGAVPLWHESRLFAGASGGYQHNRIVDTSRGQLTSTIDVVLADASLSYVPDESLLLSARYQRFQQINGSDDPLLRSFPFTRNIVMLTASIIWPPLLVPTGPYQLPQRVDQEDPSPLDKKRKDERDE